MQSNHLLSPSAVALAALILSCPVQAQLRTVLYGVHRDGAGSAGDAAVAIEAAIAGAGLSAARDPMLDGAPGDPILLQYAASRDDTIALVARVREISSGVAIEIAVGRSIVLRRYQLAEPNGLTVAVRDVARLAIDALADILAHGSERAPGPVRTAIVIDDPALRAELERPLDDAASGSAILVPDSVVVAARAFLPLEGDAGRNTAMLRERLDADRVVLVSAGESGPSLYAIDASGTTVRTFASGAAPAEIAGALAALPVPIRRPALRSAETIAIGARDAAAAPGAPAQDEHEWLAATGRDYRFVRVAHLGFAGALGFSEGGAAGGFSISENFPVYAPVNTDSLALPLNLTAQLAFLFSGQGGAFAGIVPAVLLGAGAGIQTSVFWAELHAGGGFAVSVAGVGGHPVANVVGFGMVGFRAGIPLAEHSIAEPHDQVSAFVGLDFLFGDSWSGILAAGIAL